MYAAQHYTGRVQNMLPFFFFFAFVFFVLPARLQKPVNSNTNITFENLKHPVRHFFNKNSAHSFRTRKVSPALNLPRTDCRPLPPSTRPWSGPSLANQRRDYHFEASSTRLYALPLADFRRSARSALDTVR